jgi:hypothetical protein
MVISDETSKDFDVIKNTLKKTPYRDRRQFKFHECFACQRRYTFILNILAKRVYKNRADENITEQQIKDKYQEFIVFLDDLMKDEPEWIQLRGDEFIKSAK